jgi:hypothetical protein
MVVFMKQTHDNTKRTLLNLKNGSPAIMSNISNFLPVEATATGKKKFIVNTQDSNPLITI